MAPGDQSSGESTISLRSVSSTEPTKASEKPLESLGFERPKQQKKRLPAKMQKAKEAGKPPPTASSVPLSPRQESPTSVSIDHSAILVVPEISVSALPTDDSVVSDPSSATPPTTPRADGDAAQLTPRRRGFGMSVTTRPTSQAPPPRLSVVGVAPAGSAPANFSPVITAMLVNGDLKVPGKIDPQSALELTHFVAGRDFSSFTVFDGAQLPHFD
jgi:hypothetical protein